MKPYQPSNKVTSKGFMWLLLSSVIGGVAIGGLTHLISLLIYLIVLFPLVMGLAGGAAMTLAIRGGKVRNPAIASFFGVLTGLILYGSMHGAGYLQFKQSASEQITKELGAASSNQSDAIIDTFLQDKTGSKGFLGYVKYNAQQGVSIGRIGSQGANLGETGTWIYWLVEFAVIDIMIVLAAYNVAKDPFCENCDQWYTNEERIGSVNLQSSGNFLNLLQNDQFANAGKLLDPLQGVSVPNLAVYMQCCPSCKFSDLVLTVKATSIDSKGNLEEKQVAQGMLSLSQYDKFQAAATQTLSEIEEQNAVVSDEEIRLAQLERSSVSLGDRFESHDLSTSQEANIVEQLSRYPQVKEAYLVRKTLLYFPEKPFYVLGIIRRPGWVESEAAESILVKKLMTELILPNQTWIIGLNKDRKMTKTLQQIAGQAIYRKKR